METHGLAGHLIRRLNQISTHVFQARMQQAGYVLTPVQFAALNAITTHPGVDQASIAARIAYDRATIGGVIDRLEQKGYVTRSVNKRDRRAREVHPTARGKEVHNRVLPIVKALQSEILVGLDERERDAFLRLADKAIGERTVPGDPKRVY